MLGPRRTQLATQVAPAMDLSTTLAALVIGNTPADEQHTACQRAYEVAVLLDLLLRKDGRLCPYDLDGRFRVSRHNPPSPAAGR